MLSNFIQFTICISVASAIELVPSQFSGRAVTAWQPSAQRGAVLFSNDTLLMTFDTNNCSSNFCIMYFVEFSFEYGLVSSSESSVGLFVEPAPNVVADASVKLARQSLFNMSFHSDKSVSSDPGHTAALLPNNEYFLQIVMTHAYFPLVLQSIEIDLVDAEQSTFHTVVPPASPISPDDPGEQQGTCGEPPLVAWKFVKIPQPSWIVALLTGVVVTCCAFCSCMCTWWFSPWCQSTCPRERQQQTRHFKYDHEIGYDPRNQRMDFRGEQTRLISVRNMLRHSDPEEEHELGDSENPGGFDSFLSKYWDRKERVDDGGEIKDNNDNDAGEVQLSSLQSVSRSQCARSEQCPEWIKAIRARNGNLASDRIESASIGVILEEGSVTESEVARLADVESESEISLDIN